MIHITKKYLLKIKRKKNAKKGDSGRVLMVGGGREYAGALALAGMAALRAGVDWVTIAAPQKVAWAVNALTPDLVTEKLSGQYLDERHFHQIERLAKKHTCILYGNGAGLKSGTKKLFQKMAKKISLPTVADADALKILSPKDIQNAIVTPHRREAEIFFKMKLGQKVTKADIERIQKKIKNRNVVALLKGPTDYIISEQKIYYNTTGNPGMAKAGTGDVLAGLCAGYLAQSGDLLKSAITAAYINGFIGDILLRQRKGEYSFVASDIIGDMKNFVTKTSTF